MSQGELAKQARITREYVNKLEAGRYDPTVGVLQRLAKVLSVPVTELFGVMTQPGSRAIRRKPVEWTTRKSTGRGTHDGRRGD
jgi:transcriptional regulator with XRE-family HTH domain